MANERKDIKTQIQLGYKLQTLMHMVNKETLLNQHDRQEEGKAAGIDGITKEIYEINKYENIENLLVRMKKFSYKPQAVMAEVLNEIYENIFLNISYGFRTKRNCHKAISQINYLSFD